MRRKSKKAIPGKQATRSPAGKSGEPIEDTGSQQLDPAELPRNLYENVEDMAASDETFRRLKSGMEPERLQTELEKAFDAVTIPPDELEALCRFAGDYYMRHVIAMYWAGYLRAVHEDIARIKAIAESWKQKVEHQEKAGEAGHDKDIARTRE